MSAGGSPPTVRRILLCALAALTFGLGTTSLVVGFSDSFLVRLLQGVAVFGAGVVVLGAAAVTVMVRLAGWRDPESEEDFEALVQRSERLAAGEDASEHAAGGAGRPHTAGERSRAPLAGENAGGRDAGEDWSDLIDLHWPPRRSPATITEREFRALVRDAIDKLPLEFHQVLEHVAVVISDGGLDRRAYGLYQGDTVAQDYFHDRIIIFRDALLRDFGHDPQLLRAQVTRTLRHELAHHLGWDERGVRRLGL